MKLIGAASIVLVLAVGYAATGHAPAARAEPSGAALTQDDEKNFTDVLGSPQQVEAVLHDPSEVGMDPRYAERSATGKYRTTPLRGLFLLARYFHDGSATGLLAVASHYDRHFGLNLTSAQKADLVEYLKSL